MKVTYTNETVKVVVESEHVADVLQVLGLFAPKQEEKEINLNVSVPSPVSGLQFSKPIISSEVLNYDLHRSDEAKPKLIFYKCKKCGSVSFHLGNPDDTITCYHCKDSRTLDPLHKGKYECECGASCSFLMEDSVSEISCRNKECNTKFLMLWDSATDSYEGSVE